MSHIILTRGLPASGKTTWARGWVAEKPQDRVRVNRDDIRAMLFDRPRYNHDQETLVTKAERAAVAGVLTSGFHVVVDATHLRPTYIRQWKRLAQAWGATVEVREFPIDLDEALKRNAERDRKVDEAVIRDMARKYLPKGEFLPVSTVEDEPHGGARYVPNLKNPRAVIVDIDGTVALRWEGRDIYDGSLAHMDHPNDPVVRAVWHALESGCKIVFCSGRDERDREVTEQWIRAYITGNFELHMRPEGDRRKDAIVKRELFDNHIRDRFNVLYVLDDRNQVVDMWRDLGLTCLQVAPGEF